MNAIELYKNNDHVIVIAAIEFSRLNSIVRFTRKEESYWSNDTNSSNDTDQYYQRPTNEKRVKGIKKHIEEVLFDSTSNNDVLFPSSLILSMELDNEDIKIKNGGLEFKIPEETESCLIVDGQHRLKAMKTLFEEFSANPVINESKIQLINQYKFNCTILINYDLWEQSRIFASVNFNQKPVDRSLYYDIFGEVPKENIDMKFSNLYIAHELGKYLNTSTKSPIKGFVKNFIVKEGFISQAFLTESILALLGPRSNWNYIVDNYKDNGDLHKKLPKIFVGYFVAIKNTFPDYWPKSTNKLDATILSKTNGLGALIKLLGWIDRILKLGFFPNYKKTDLLDLTLEEITQLFEKIFNPLNDIGIDNTIPSKTLFGEGSPYLGGGSVGLQNQLFKELAKILGIEYDRKLLNN